MHQQTLLPQRSSKIPGWMPDIWRPLVAGSVTVELPRQVRRRARRPVKIPYSKWAEINREVTEGAHPGKWRHDYAAHTVKIMDTYCQPWVREVWLCKVEQSGGTNTLINLLLAGTDCDPGDAFLLMPTEKDSNKMVGRLKNTLRASRRVCDLVSDKADDTTLDRIALTNGVTIHPAHANSPSSMSSRPAKYAFGDEIDKYPALSGREADPITLIRKRGRTFKGRVKRFFCSTPAGMFIYQGMQDCHQIWEARVRCPHCGDLVKMDAEHLLIPADATPENIDQLGVGYACNSCEQHWDEEDRLAAIRAGASMWECVKGADVSRPARVGFHHRAWECLDVSLAEIASAWLKKKTGDHAAQIAWANGYMAENYTHTSAERANSAILSLCDTRPSNMVPVADISELLLTIDTQKDHFWYVLRAHGYGMEQEGWLISCGVLPSFSAIDQMLDEHVYYDAEGGEHRIGRAMIDTGGTRHADAEHSRTYEVYDWARDRKRRVYPYKGARASSKPWTLSNIDNYPNGKPMRGGLKLYNVNANYYKDELDRRLNIPPTDPGAFHLHSGYTEHQLADIATGEKKPQNGLTEYARHMVGEYCDDSGQWLPHGGKRHDLWDCEYMQIALADILRIKHIQTPDSGGSAPRRRTSNKRNRHD